MGDAGSDATPLPERRGYLLNEYTGAREYFVLRGGVLRIRQAPSSPDTGTVYLAHGSSVKLLASSVLEVNSKVPFVQEYVLAATSDKEAEGWHDAILDSIKAEQLKMQKLAELLENGCTMHKYNYSNSKRSRRYFWVSDEGRQLCWGRSKGEVTDDTQSVNLNDCIGIIYGPMTTTFQRCTSVEDPAWTCFSLLFMGRTLDLAVAGDLQVSAWFLGMQHLISLHGIGSMPIMTEAQFITRKVQYKIQAVAHRNGMVLGRYLLQRLRAIAAGRGLTGLGPGAVVNGGRLAVPMSLSSAVDTVRGSNGLKLKDRKKADDPEAASRLSALRARASQLQATLRERSVQADSVEKALQKAASLPNNETARQVALKEAALSVLKKRCAGLEEEVQQMAEAAEKAAPQVKEAEKSEKSLRKLQKKLDESEERRATLEHGLKSAQASAAASSGAKQSSSVAEGEAKAKGQGLQRQVQDLERQLHEVQVKDHSEKEGAKNLEQDKAIAAAEQEKLALEQKLAEKDREVAKIKELEAQSHAQLKRTRDMSERLDAAVRPLNQAVARLKDEQRKTRAELLDAGKSFGGQIQALVEATSKVGAEVKDMESAFRAAMEDRKKLHNLVLDLKGNIRVFVRVRPINEKEKPHEPEGESTIGFRDDTNIGAFDASHGRRKWFEFDQVFSPTTGQSQVFEEAKPLATSVLDGYNVCIFAYGQTGSGKTHTMTGTPKDPGLNTNVLRELFRIRDERRGESDIDITLSITEIYNENIRDLLCPAASKKLDVKINQDGTCCVPGLEERDVKSVDEVMRCIGDANKNRATSTTDMNEQSSRSHSIVTVRTQCALKGGDTYVGKIHLIDLAGSENTNKSGVTGQGMKEAQNINKSLSALGDVISSLVAKNPHTPYRNSKLTMMLKDSLGGDSKTLMIVCTSPAQFNVTETMSSLNFASRARNVELGQAKRNVASK